MKCLRYRLHQRGRCGWSNALMSLECGVVIAHMTDRTLAVEGNISPPANLRSEGGVKRVLESGQPRKATVTDLYEIPVRWFSIGADDLLDDGTASFELLSDEALYSCVYYFGDDVDTQSEDFRAFAHKRLPKNFVHGSRFSDAEIASIDTMNALSFYSYLFYLRPEERREVHRLLRQMRPKAPYLQFAARVVERIGPFNAVHIRLGDFRQTSGVTTRMRTVADVVESLQRHFDRRQTLVVCTDESENEAFFGELRRSFPNLVILDTFILEDPELAEAYRDLPFHDDMAMSVITQLVAGESDDFVGSMTSTFTAMIHRFRGNNGKSEDFKFLWCEVPDPGVPLERGRHAIAKTIPFENNRFIEALEGPYSWNRIDLWVGCEYYGWFREWPESFLRTS